MADKKIEKALYGPSLTEVALGAILGLAAGVLAACAYLIFKPVSMVREMPKEPVRGMVYYIPGSDSSSKGRTQSAKIKQWVGGGSISLNEDELNAWATGAFAYKPAAGTPGASGAAYSGIFNPGKPNFRIHEGKLQISFKCVLNWYGVTQEVTVVTTGHFERSGDKFVYAPDTLFLGSCPLHLLPVVANPLISNLTSKRKASDDINSTWAKLKDVTIEGNALKLTVQ